MKILFLTSRFPFPPIGGDKLRVFYFLRHLSRSHDVDLLSLIADDDELGALDAYRDTVSSVHTVRLSKRTSFFNCLCGLLRGGPLQNHYFRSREAKRLITSLLDTNNYDLVFVHLIRMADYVKEAKYIPKFIDLTDALSLNYERAKPYHRGIDSIINNVEHKRVLEYESEIMNYFERGSLVSRYDRDFMGSFSDIEKIEVIPNGVNLEYFNFQPNERPSNHIIFLGNLRTFPNTDAAVYFAREIFPYVKREIPDVLFTVLGQEPGRRVKELAGESGVTVTNGVPDVRPYLVDSLVSVCPLRAGAGVQNKILESMAVGTPVVTTSIGLEGIEAEPEREILLADEADQFARCIIRLMKDPNLRRKLSINLGSS